MHSATWCTCPAYLFHTQSIQIPMPTKSAVGHSFHRTDGRPAAPAIEDISAETSILRLAAADNHISRAASTI